MLHERRIAVIIPAFREARLIGRTLQGVPDYVDDIFVVDDKSDDATAEVARKHGDGRVSVLEHPENRGVGASIVTGYQRAIRSGSDVLAVMAADNQMHPDDLRAVVTPVALGRADYVKGNRFVHPEARRMPLLRRLGGEFLSAATRAATGLAVTDCQCGYTALSSSAARSLPLESLWPRFGYPNDLLGMLAARGLRVHEVPVRPVYADEESGIRAFHVVSILGIIARRFWIESRRSAY